MLFISYSLYYFIVLFWALNDMFTIQLKEQCVQWKYKKKSQMWIH